MTITRTPGNFGNPRIRFFIKRNSETIQSDTTFTDDNDLQFEAKANTNYLIMYCRVITSDPSADFKEVWSVPTGATINRISTFWHAGGGNVSVNFALQLVTFDPSIQESNCSPCLLVMGSTPGTVAWQWAQNGSVAVDTTVLAGSYLMVMEANGN